MAVTITISIEGEEPIERTIDPATLTLGALEDLETMAETKKTRDLVTAMTGFFRITRAQARQITQEQLGQIMAAIREANDVTPTTG